MDNQMTEKNHKEKDKCQHTSKASRVDDGAAVDKETTQEACGQQQNAQQDLARTQRRVQLAAGPRLWLLHLTRDSNAFSIYFLTSDSQTIFKVIMQNVPN